MEIPEREGLETGLEQKYHEQARLGSGQEHAPGDRVVSRVLANNEAVTHCKLRMRPAVF